MSRPRSPQSILRLSHRHESPHHGLLARGIAFCDTPRARVGAREEAARGDAGGSAHAYADSSWWQIPGVMGYNRYAGSGCQGRSKALSAAAAEVAKTLSGS